ncbi:alanine racemase [Lacrimispora indolis]|uniref:alanine racemase n=1 Tax=Lacrimispora indolis TaxID=69825 RepID=UPI00045E6D3A|nr:alanine racemase [Lacrimispora indolis]
MELTQEQIEQLETPCLVIDVDLAEKNIRRMQEAADKAGCRLRPHIKTHKMPLFAQMQEKAGASGITCAKVSEAEVMADGGMEDIFIAYPMVGHFRIQRAITLAKKIKRLILTIDSLEGAKALEQEASGQDMVLEVRMEIDTGAGRTGVPMDRAVELALAVKEMKHLNLTGIFTFKSLILSGKPTEDNLLAAEEEGKMMAETALMLKNAGVEIQDISAGSSPTGTLVAQTGMVNEIRPGTYIFDDFMLTKEKVAELSQIAVRFYATVVSCQHSEYAVVDGGTKCFPTDVAPGQPPFYYPGYAVVEGDDNLRLSRMNEEHGIITAINGQTGLQVGQVISLIPIHVCTAVNMQNSIYLLENGSLRKQKVDARGMLI